MIFSTRTIWSAYTTFFLPNSELVISVIQHIQTLHKNSSSPGHCAKSKLGSQSFLCFKKSTPLAMWLGSHIPLLVGSWIDRELYQLRYTTQIKPKNFLEQFYLQKYPLSLIPFVLSHHMPSHRGGAKFSFVAIQTRKKIDVKRQSYKCNYYQNSNIILWKYYVIFTKNIYIFLSSRKFQKPGTTLEILKSHLYFLLYVRLQRSL